MNLALEPVIKMKRAYLSDFNGIKIRMGRVDEDIPSAAIPAGSFSG
jgi:hypothetical protein